MVLPVAAPAVPFSVVSPVAAPLMSFPVAVPAVVLSVMAALGVRHILERASCERLGRCIRASRNPGVQGNARLCQGILRPASDAAADQGIRLMLPQEPGQRPMAAPRGIHHLRGDDRTVLNLVQLKLLGMAKMLENLSIFIGNCKFHDRILL